MTQNPQSQEKGIEKGIEKGREEGKEEKAIQVVRNSLAKGLDVETIIDITGLDRETVLKTQKSSE